MTFIEIMLVVALIGMVSLALYKSFANGLRVWQKSRELIVEEDILIFFDKFAQDLRNTFVYTSLPFKGDIRRVDFPAFVWMPSMNSHEREGEFKDQMGRIEYSYDDAQKQIIRRQANYSQAMNGAYEMPQTVARFIDSLHFRYYYLTSSEEVFSEEVLEVMPAGIEVTVQFSDVNGTREIKRYFNIPLKI